MFLSGKIPKEKAKNMNVLALAFVGDAAYTLAVREKLAETTDFKSGALNVLSAEKVCARAQAKRADFIAPYFTEEEAEIFQRGRNAKKNTRAKHATVAEYNASTGFEAVLGYLTLTGNEERLDFLINFDGDKNL